MNKMNRSFSQSLNNMSMMSNSMIGGGQKFKNKINNRDSSKYMDQQNPKTWAKAIQQNIGRSIITKQHQPPIIQRQYQNMVAHFLQNKRGTGQQQLKKQFMFQVKQKMTQQRVIQQMDTISRQIFFFPSKQLKTHLGSNWKQILFKSIAMKLPDLKMLEGGRSIQSQKQYILQNIWCWGDIFLDIQKLQYFSKTKIAQKGGNNLQRIYDLPFYDLQVKISKKGIQVKYKGLVVSSSQFSTKILRQMAIQRITQRVKNLISQFAKYSERLFKQQIQNM